MYNSIFNVQDALEQHFLLQRRFQRLLPHKYLYGGKLGKPVFSGILCAFPR